MARKISVSGKFSRGRLALVDAEDYPLLSRHRWRFCCSSGKNKNNGYVAMAREGHAFKMHHLIFPKHKTKNQVIDHINGNSFDNRKKNLRWCTVHQNSMNKKVDLQRLKRGLYKGVQQYGKRSFQARICFNNKRICLGTFRSSEDAAHAYNEAAKKYFGQYALLNIIHRLHPAPVGDDSKKEE